MRIIKVNEKNNNNNLISFLKEEFPNLPNSIIYKALRKKDIRINNIRITENCKLQTGDELKIFITDNFLDGASPDSSNTSNKNDIPIVFQDENILIFNKPIEMEVTGNNSLTSYAKCNLQLDFIEPCHRLDRNTSGLVIFAKNQTALDEMLLAFKNHTVEKHYICVCVGIPKEKNKRLEAYLFKDAKKSQVYISDAPKAGYQNIITSYNLINSNKEKNISLLNVLLETGRTHQIRAHLAHIGLPILGDGKYGNNAINKGFHLKYQLLTSYSVTFHFSDKSALNYLNNATIKLKTLPYLEKYFSHK